MMLHAAFDRLPAPGDEWEGRHCLGPCPEGAVTLADLAAEEPALARLVALKQAQAKGGDARLGCAYLVGDLAWEVGNILAALWLAGWRVAGADSAAIAITTRAVTWEDEGETGTGQVFDLTLDPAGLTGGGVEPLDLARAMEGLHAGTIATLARLTGLGAAAQWRLVGDGLTGALIHRGQAMGQIETALALGRAITSNRSTRLYARQTEFVEVRHPRRLGISEWFRLRGGCCRYYTSAGGEYCTTCVHRDRDDQIARLATYLEEIHAVE